MRDYVGIDLQQPRCNRTLSCVRLAGQNEEAALWLDRSHLRENPFASGESCRQSLDLAAEIQGGEY
jgi:hypothetical protein